MISLFDANAVKSDLVQTNGDYVLDMICTSAVITEELNGEYSFDGDFRIVKSFPAELYDMLQEESILKVDDEYGKEYFRIAKVIKTSKKITVFARHLTISDILTLWCEDVRPESQNGAGAIRWIYDNSIGNNKMLSVTSDITITNTAYYVNKNVYEALFTTDNSFLDRWGGEVYRRGFNLSINQKVGADRGVTIRSKKNLTGFEATTNLNSLVTRIYPKGYNGITINEKYVDSEYINNYGQIYSKEVKFEDVKVKEEEEDEEGFNTLEEAQEELKRLSKEMYTADKVDILTASYRINFVELAKTEEYKNFSILETTFLGDTVEIIEDKLGINISVRVLKRKYDLLKKKRLETELSDKDIKEKPPTINQIITEINKIPESMQGILNEAKEHATNLINAGINGFVVCNKNEILIMDTADKNTAINVWRWNINGLGHSSTGYYGTYETALTADGKIVLNEVTCEAINAILIKGGSITGFNGNLSLNLEEDEFSFTHSEASTRTVIDAEGFYIEDENGEKIASLASKDSWTELKANKVFAGNIMNLYDGDSNIYINHDWIGECKGTQEKPFNSFSQLRELLNYKIINKDINIYILSKEEINDVLYILGTIGTGNIYITYSENVIHRNIGIDEGFNIDIRNCNNRIVFNGGRSAYNATNGALITDRGNQHGIRIVDCRYVEINNITIDCKHWGVYCNRSNLIISVVDFGKCYNAVQLEGASTCYDCSNNSGTCTEAYKLNNGSRLVIGTGGSGRLRAKGSIIENGGIVSYCGAISNIAERESYRFGGDNTNVIPPNSNFSESFALNSRATYQYAWGNWKSGEAKSGVYGSYGDKAGHLFFDLTAIRNFLNGGTVLDGATITLTRANAGGSSGGVNISVGGSSCSSASGTPSYSNKGGVGTLSWGQTNTFTLNKAIVEGIKNGTINSITTHGSGYSDITNAIINLKVNK